MSPKKIVRTIVYFTLLSMFTACESDRDFCNCGENPYETDLILNTIKTTSFDNSGPSISFDKEATNIPYKAIALRIALSDSVSREIVGHANTTPTCTNWDGSVRYLTCDWFSPRFNFVKKITALRIITLYDFSDELPARTEITNLFLAYWPIYQENDKKDLYTEIDSIIDSLQTDNFIHQRNFNLNVVLTQPALCDSMRLEISVEFDDNSALTDTTSTIYPIK
jgi:hypothetical protein